MDEAIFVGIGANLRSPACGSPLATCMAAVDAMARVGISVRRLSRWYRSRPVPASDQPTFVNGVASVATPLSPPGLLAALHAIEVDFGRVRRRRNEARVLDLDLLAYGSRVTRPGDALVLPHPRMHQRAFVLMPLAELAPDWVHPRLGVAVSQLAAVVAREEMLGPIEPEPAGRA